MTDRLLILASGSPQRKRLLEEAGYHFRRVPPRDHAECGVCSRETAGEMVSRLAYQKAADVLDQLRSSAPAQPSAVSPKDITPHEIAPQEIIVGCDTLCECAGQILGKPHNREHAGEMLRLLSNREHHVYSGLCLWPLAGDPSVRVARTRLKMDALSPEQIEEYLASDEWEGKAGAFGYQDRPGWLHLVEGSESNVIGLPLELLAEMLAQNV